MVQSLEYSAQLLKQYPKKKILLAISDKNKLLYS